MRIDNDNVVYNPACKYESVTVYKYNLFHEMYDADKIPVNLVKDIIGEWKRTAKGQWCMDHAVSFNIVKESDYSVSGHNITVRALFSDKDAILFYLKWPVQNK